MLEIFLFHCFLFSLSWLGKYLSFYKLTSNSWVKAYGVWPEGKEGKEEYFEQARKSAFTSEVTRSGVFIFGGFLIVLIFTLDKGGMFFLLQSQILFPFIYVITPITVLYTLFVAPPKIAKKSGQKLSFREHVLPCIANFPYYYSVWAGVGITTATALLEGVSVDLDIIRNAADNLLAGILHPTNSLTQFQKSTLLLVSLGNSIASTAQKYIVMTLIALFYLIVEQRTYMEKTMLKDTLDRLKYLLWMVFIITVLFGVFYLPSIYVNLHSAFSNILIQMVTATSTANEIEAFYSIQNHLESHDLSWLTIKILSGYGNIITFLIIGTSLLLRRFLFKNATPIEIIKLLFPKKIYKLVTGVAEDIGVNLNNKVE